MIQHIVFWNFKGDLTDSDRRSAGLRMKKELESLKDKVSGAAKVEVAINPLSSSTVDIALNSLFETADALNQYQIHPDHLKIKEFIHTVIKERYCLDYDTDENTLH